MAIKAPDGSGSKKTASATSAAYAIPDSSQYRFLLMHNAGTVPVHYRLGAASATAVAYDGSGDDGDPVVMPGGMVDVFIGDSATHLALVTESGTAVVHFYPYTEAAEG